ncbi:MAG TPA: UvrD-helicase domain-containing protein, partial [Tepidisphaeraceae bacterium]|nr:UvrD-helicase domain-containing protein [Tepidisphaeraceae bacterium]
MKWTRAQLEGITADGGSLLVSAAAGSGKTAVLAARCVHMVCQAKEPCDVDELLVMTFTESAAAEMRERIGRALREFRGEEGRLRRQLALLEHAQISTVHSFCARLLRQNFNVAGVDPAFAVMDDDESKLLKRETAERIFEQHYENDPNGAFHGLVSDYGNGDDDWLMKRVIWTHDTLNSLVHPDRWISECRGMLREAGSLPLNQSQLGKELLREIEKELTRMEERCRATQGAVKELGLARYAERLGEFGQIIGTWRRLGLDELRDEVLSLTLDRAPVEKGANRLTGKKMLDEVAESLKEKGALYRWVRFTEKERIDGQASTLAAAEIFLDLVGEFGREYAEAKEEINALDFSDLERKALGILIGEDGGPSDVARMLHGQFKHVLVDEYQDINEIQGAILGAVSRECLAEGVAASPARGRAVGNLFTVGDVKQSIFRFRLAEPERFLERNEAFRKRGAIGRVIDLRENFRSRGPLLGAINETFRRLMTREAAEIEYDRTHELSAGAEFGEPGELREQTFNGAPIELHLLPAKTGEEPATRDEETEEMERGEIEALLLARRIRQIVGADGGEGMCVFENGRARRAKYGDIVILLRSMKFQADAYASILRREGVPVHSDGGRGFFDATEVRDIVALLRVLDNQRQDIPLAAVLRSPIANLPEAEESLARIRLAAAGAEKTPSPALPRDSEYRVAGEGEKAVGDHDSEYRGTGEGEKAVARPDSERRVAEGGEKPRDVPFHEAVRKYAESGNDELAAKLRDFLAVLNDWRRRARRQPLAELLWHIYDSTGYLAFCAGLEDGKQRVANLMHLHQRAGQFGTFARQGLHRFMRFLEALK